MKVYVVTPQEGKSPLRDWDRSILTFSSKARAKEHTYYGGKVREAELTIGKIVK